MMVYAFDMMYLAVVNSPSYQVLMLFHLFHVKREDFFLVSMYVMVKQRKRSTVTAISLLYNRCHRISHHRFLPLFYFSQKKILLFSY
jgi:hypothetical protein